MPYFRGQGKLLAGLRDGSTSNPLSLRWVGNCPEMKVSFSTTKLEHKESWSGNMLTDVQVITEKKAAFSCVLEEWNKENLAFLFNGVAADLTGTTPVTNQPILGSTTLAVGQFFRLPRRNLSAVTIKDSTGSPKTLVANTNYKLYAKEGMIEILDITTGAPWTGPLTADYTPAVSSEVAMFNAPAQDMWFRFLGMNMSNNGVPVVIDLFKVQLDAAKEFSVIGDDIAKFPLEGTVLMDSLRPSNDILGQFGNVTILT
jgi:hypothetical protein